MKQNIFHSGEAKYLIAIYMFAALMVFLYGRIDRGARVYATSPDINAYRQMAQDAPNFSETVPKPYAYRVLGPYMAGLLPLPDPDAFYLCAIILFAALVASFYSFLRYMSIHASYAAAATIFVILNKSLVGFALWECFRLDDLLTFIELIWLFWMMQERRWTAFSFILTIGALTRETPLLMIAVAFFYITEQHTLSQDLKKLIAAAIPAVVCSIWLRAVIHAPAGLSIGGSFLDSYIKFKSPGMWFRIFINAFIPLSFLPLIYYRQSVLFLKEKKYMMFFLIMIFISTFFGGDNERLIAPAFIVMYLLYAQILQTELGASSLPLSVLICAAFLTTFNDLFARYPVSRSTMLIVSYGATAAATLYLIQVKRKRNRAKNDVFAAGKT